MNSTMPDSRRLFRTKPFPRPRSRRGLPHLGSLAVLCIGITPQLVGPIRSTMADDGIRAPGQVVEGGVIEVEVTNGATQIDVYIDTESTPTTVDVHDGKASVQVPPRASAGSLITILTKTSIPTGVLVEVIGTTSG